MFKIAQTGPNRLDIELSGKLDAEAMRSALDQFQKHSKNIENGMMLYDIVDFQIPTPGALLIEFYRMPTLFSVIKQYRRAAVLTDRPWIKNVSESESFLFSGLKIKAFDRDQRQQAVSWLMQD